MRQLDELMELSSPQLSDKIGQAERAAEVLLLATRKHWPTDGMSAVSALRARRPDSPLLLAVTEAGLDPVPERAADGLESILTRLRSTTWLVDMALKLSSASSLGILSLGETTIGFLQTFLDATGSELELYTNKRAVARGLGNLGLPIFVGDPISADILVIPTQCRHDQRIWTTPSIVKVIKRSKGAIRTMEHPVAHLSPVNRLAYRPHIALTDYVLP
jgi:hypothetical protein